MSTKNLIEQYIEGWKVGDITKITITLTDNCVIIESHGPVYRGKEKVKQWIQNWNAARSKVDDWDITSFFIPGIIW